MANTGQYFRSERTGLELTMAQFWLEITLEGGDGGMLGCMENPQSSLQDTSPYGLRTKKGGGDR